jgi:hypothetical protein
MLKNASDITGCAIDATDGQIGSIVDLLLDEDGWPVRWAVVDTGGWLSGRQVLIPPSALEGFDPTGPSFAVNLTRDQVADSPGIDDDAPVDRQHETNLYRHYGWHPYWTPYPVTPIGAPIPAHLGPVEVPAEVEAEVERGDPHLRSAGEVTGYYVHASDGDIGHVEDFLVDVDAWIVRYAVIDTRNWWPGRKVLVATQAITMVDWAEGAITLDLTRDRVRNAPEYDPSMTIDKEFEQRFHGYYGYPFYW